MHWCFSPAGSKKFWECNLVKRKENQYSTRYVSKQKRCCGWREIIIAGSALTVLPLLLLLTSYMVVTEFMYSPWQSSAGDILSLTFSYDGYLEIYLLLSLWRWNWNQGGKFYESFHNTFCLPAFSLWCFLSLKASSALPYCCDNVLTWWLPEHACSILHLGMFWACCCSQGSCLARTSILLGLWTWEEPQPRSHSCHGLRWGVVKIARVGTAGPVERPEHCCTLWYHFVSTGTSRTSVVCRTSVVYRTSIFLFRLTSAVGW